MTLTTNANPEYNPPVPPVQLAPAVKPGWWTSEHVLSLLAALLTACYASGLIPTGGVVGQVAAIAATVLTAIGYTVSRTLVKTAGRQ